MDLVINGVAEGCPIIGDKTTLYVEREITNGCGEFSVPRFKQLRRLIRALSLGQ